MAVAVGLTFAFPLDGAGQDRSFGFPVGPAYDTVATVGWPDETHPFRIYSGLAHQVLIDSTTILYADRSGGRVVVLDVVTNDGWEVDDGGSDGPGEYGGRQPWISETRGTLYFAAQDMQGSTRSSVGELRSTWRYAEPFWGIWGQPAGILESSVVVTHTQEFPDMHGTGTQRLAQGISAYSPERGRVWSYEVPHVTTTVSAGKWGEVQGPGAGIVVAARHETVAVIQNGERWVLALEPDGSERAKATLPYDPFTSFVDAQERIWVQVWKRNDLRTGSYVVLDRNLDQVMNVTERSVFDAWGDYLLTISSDENDVEMMHVLRRR